MTEETDALSDGIARALSAASAANDAAQDLDQLQAGHRAFVERVTASQKRMQALTLGVLAGAGLAVLLGGLVYFRSLADLREAAELQAKASEAMVTRLTELATALETAKGLSERLEAQEAAILAAVEGLGERLAGDLEEFAGQAAAVEPQFATAIQSHIDESLATTRDALLAAVGDLDVELKKALAEGAPVPADLRRLVEEMKGARTPAPAAARSAPATAPRPAARAPKPRAPAPAPAPADNPIRFP